MSKINISRVLFLTSLFLCISYSSYAFAAKVIKVTDGDTLTVLTPDFRQIRIRLYGIDCPERKQPFGSVATRFTRDQVAGKEVEIEDMGKDRYGRIIGIVGSLNRDLVGAGLAWIYPRYCKASFCKAWRVQERKARQEKRGLWQNANAVPPWKWRKGQRK